MISEIWFKIKHESESQFKFAKIVRIRKEVIHTVSYEVYSMLSMFYRIESPGVTRAKNLRKGTKPKIRKIISPHLLKRWQKTQIISSCQHTVHTGFFWMVQYN